MGGLRIGSASEVRRIGDREAETVMASGEERAYFEGGGGHHSHGGGAAAAAAVEGATEAMAEEAIRGGGSPETERGEEN